jgi:hypothetical protein
MRVMRASAELAKRAVIAIATMAVRSDRCMDSPQIM